MATDAGARAQGRVPTTTPFLVGRLAACRGTDYTPAFHPARLEDPAYQQVLASLDSKSGQLSCRPIGIRIDVRYCVPSL